MTKSKSIIGGLLSVVAVGVCAYWGLSNRGPAKYSFEWIKNLTDVEWETEREIVRQNYCNPKFDMSTRSNFHNLLRLFDKVKSDRDWSGQEPRGPAYHREHGWYLPNDD